MKIIKRNGSEEVFDINKIVIAVTKADINSEERSLMMVRSKILQSMLNLSAIS